MINFSNLPPRTMAGRIARFPLKFLPKNLAVPILQGPNAGLKWFVGAATHGCWLGSFEAQKQREIADSLTKGDCFYDVGANAGFYSLLGSRIVGKTGRVVSFEPYPRNLHFLAKHIEINQCQNVDIYSTALAKTQDWTRIRTANGPAQAQIGDKEGPLNIYKTSLDAILRDELLPPPDIIKIDIEGAEVEMLEGAKKCLTQHDPIVFVATHGPHVHRETTSILKDFGYSISGLMTESPRNTDELIALPG